MWDYFLEVITQIIALLVDWQESSFQVHKSTTHINNRNLWDSNVVKFLKKILFNFLKYSGDEDPKDCLSQIQHFLNFYAILVVDQVLQGHACIEEATPKVGES